MHVGIAGVGRTAAAGAEVAATPRDLATRVAAAITILSKPAALTAVYAGPDGLLHADVSGKPFIEMSTVAPAVEAGLADKVRASGGRYLKCPVGGTVGPARAGTGSCADASSTSARSAPGPA